VAYRWASGWRGIWYSFCTNRWSRSARCLRSRKCKIIGRFTDATGAAFCVQIDCQKRRHDSSSSR
jgi:hypothetical protein